MAKFNLGYDEETQQELNVDSDVEKELIDEKRKEFEERRKDYKKDTTAFLSERRIELLKQEMDAVVVNEFGDEYHLSEEERRQRNKYHDLFKNYLKYKHTYKKLDEYITVMREAIDIARTIADNNGVYDPDKFIKMWLKGKIRIEGLKLPKYKGRNRNQLDWDYVSEFILGDDPVEDILPPVVEESITEDEIAEDIKVLFDEDDWNRIFAETDVYTEINNSSIDNDSREIRGDELHVSKITKKEQKALLKSNPSIMQAIKENRREERARKNLARYAYDIIDGDINEIEKRNSRYGAQDVKVPEFHGDITKDKDYYRYMRKLELFEENHTYEVYAGKKLTPAQINELELRTSLEAHGWNLRSMYGNKEREKRHRKMVKNEKKRTRKIKERFIAMQNRKNARQESLRKMGVDFDTEKKATKKKKKKKKKQKPVLNKTFHEVKARSKKNVDEFLLASMKDTDHDGFMELSDDTLDFRMGGEND